MTVEIPIALIVLSVLGVIGAWAVARKRRRDLERMIDRRVAGIERGVAGLRDVLLEPIPEPKIGLGVPGYSQSKLPHLRSRLRPGTPADASRARVGRAAKRAGMTYKAWVEKYGERETNP